MINPAQGSQVISAVMHDYLVFGEDAVGLTVIKPGSSESTLLNVVKTEENSTTFVDLKLFAKNGDHSVLAGKVALQFDPAQVSHIAELIAQVQSGHLVDDGRGFPMGNYMWVSGTVHADARYAHGAVGVGERAGIELNTVYIEGDSFSVAGELNGVSYRTDFIEARALEFNPQGFTRSTYSGDPELFIHMAQGQSVPSSAIIDRLTLLSYVATQHIEGGFDSLVESSSGSLSYRVAASILNGDTIDDLLDDMVDQFGLTTLEPTIEHEIFPKTH